MKRRILMGLMLPLLMVAGLAFNASAASADDSGGVQRCAYGFCYQVSNNQGSRQIRVDINPGNNGNMCVEAFSWNAGTPTTILPRGRMTANQWRTGFTSVYAGYKDATIHATNCTTGAKIFTFKVASWNFANGFI